MAVSAERGASGACKVGASIRVASILRGDTSSERRTPTLLYGIPSRAAGRDGGGRENVEGELVEVTQQPQQQQQQFGPDLPVTPIAAS